MVKKNQPMTKHTSEYVRDVIGRIQGDKRVGTGLLTPSEIVFLVVPLLVDYEQGLKAWEDWQVRNHRLLVDKQS